MILNLGVVDIPYVDEKSTTTISVAKKLEKEYGVIQHFVDLYLPDMTKLIEKSVNVAMDEVLSGGVYDFDVFNSSETRIEKLFKFDFLESGQIEKLGLPGIPTQAAIDRRSLRFKSKKAKKKRPSFIDTGTYETAFTAWVE